jgi:GNS1/SUR4 family
VSWVPITLNLFVHVVMYWYYFQAARGVKIWWKEWITRLQIIQFVLDLGFVYFASYNYFANEYFPQIPHFGSCAGEEFAAIMGCGILSSYLVLFISFYLATYKKGKPASRNARRSISSMNKTELPTAAKTTEKASEALEVAKDAVVSTVNSTVNEIQNATGKQE